MAHWAVYGYEYADTDKNKWNEFNVLLLAWFLHGHRYADMDKCNSSLGVYFN